MSPLDRPHPVQILDDIVELNAVAPIHLERLERADLAERVQHVALQLIRNLALDERDDDETLSGAHGRHLVHGGGRIEHDGARFTLEAYDLRAHMRDQLASFDVSQMFFQRAGEARGTILILA